MLTDDADRALGLGGPGLRLWAGSFDDLAEWQLRLQQARPGAAVLRLRGSRCLNAQALFDEAAAVLQFPYWAGANWRAFEDCLLALGWLPATAYVLLFEDASQLLIDAAPDSLKGLCDILARAQRAWEAGGPQPLPFKAYFHALPEQLPALRARLQTAGVDID